MIYLMDAILLAWVAAIWSKSGGANIAIALVFTVAALMNAIGAAPIVSKWIAF